MPPPPARKCYDIHIFQLSKDTEKVSFLHSQFIAVILTNSVRYFNLITFSDGRRYVPLSSAPWAAARPAFPSATGSHHAPGSYYEILRNRYLGTRRKSRQTTHLLQIDTL